MPRCPPPGRAATRTSGDHEVPLVTLYSPHRSLVLDRAIRRGTDNVVICRMRFRPTTWSAN